MGADYYARCVLGAMVTEADFMRKEVYEQPSCEHPTLPGAIFPTPPGAIFCPICGVRVQTVRRERAVWKRPGMFERATARGPHGRSPLSWNDAVAGEFRLGTDDEGPYLLAMALSSEDTEADVIIGYVLGDVAAGNRPSPGGGREEVDDLTARIGRILASLDVHRDVRIYTYCYVSV